MANCNCIGIYTPCINDGCNDPDVTCSDVCFISDNPLVKVGAGVGPCGQSSSIDITTDSFYTACTGTVFFSIVEYDTNGIASATITQAGVLTYVTSAGAEPNRYYNIIYKAQCLNESYASFGTANIGITDICTATACDPGFVCDKCTGTCIEMECGEGDVVVTTNLC